MPTTGSSIFPDADGYQNSLRDLLDLLVTAPVNLMQETSGSALAIGPHVQPGV